MALLEVIHDIHNTIPFLVLIAFLALRYGVAIYQWVTGWLDYWLQHHD